MAEKSKDNQTERLSAAANDEFMMAHLDDELIGYTLDKIRRRKNIPITEIEKNVFSRQQYNRFVKGKNSISLDNFLKLLNLFKVSIVEISNILIPGQEDLNIFWSRFYTGIRHDSASEIGSLTNWLKGFLRSNNHILIRVLELVQAHIKGEPVDRTSADELFTYLQEFEILNLYELRIFEALKFVLSRSNICSTSQKPLLALGKCR